LLGFGAALAQVRKRLLQRGDLAEPGTVLRLGKARVGVGGHLLDARKLGRVDPQEAALHAGIRCPMLTLKPSMLPRLDEIEEDLVQRRQHANAQGWHGEIEGIDLTLTFLRSKRGQTQRAISLGMPTTAPARQKA
jgi:hypothetical protein